MASVYTSGIILTCSIFFHVIERNKFVLAEFMYKLCWKYFSGTLRDDLIQNKTIKNHFNYFLSLKPVCILISMSPLCHVWLNANSLDNIY